jgi:amidase
VLDPVEVAARALDAAGAECVDAPELDVRDEALDISRRHWARERLSGAENLRSLQDRDRFRRRLLVATSELDVLITPVTTEPAPPWRKSVDTDFVWTLPWSLTGAPVVVVPAGTRDGLPMAVQIIGRPWQDHVALAVAQVIEAAVES